MVSAKKASTFPTTRVMQLESLDQQGLLALYYDWIVKRIEAYQVKILANGVIVNCDDDETLETIKRATVISALNMDFKKYLAGEFEDTANPGQYIKPPKVKDLQNKLPEGVRNHIIRHSLDVYLRGTLEKPPVEKIDMPLARRKVHVLALPKPLSFTPIYMPIADHFKVKFRG